MTDMNTRKYKGIEEVEEINTLAVKKWRKYRGNHEAKKT